MDADDVKRVVQSLDEALRIFRQYEGRLTASQVRARSMLSVVRAELAPGIPLRFPEEDRLFVDDAPIDGMPSNVTSNPTARPWAKSQERPERPPS